MVGFYLLAFPRFPLRKKEHKSYYGKNQTHDFRTSRCAGCLLDHSGDEQPYSVVMPYDGDFSAVDGFLFFSGNFNGNSKVDGNFFGGA